MDRLRTVNPMGLENSRTKAMMSLGDWKGAVELLQRSWFYRIWIIQETAVASQITVLCGGQKISWEDLFYISELFSTSRWGTWVLSVFHKPGCGGLTVGTTPFMLETIRKGIIGAQVWCLDALVHSGRPFEATDLKDKIYALLRISRPSSGSQLKYPTAEYRLPTSEVYTEAMKFMLEDSTSFLLLSFVEDKSQRILEQLPSWVPDFSISTGHGLAFEGRSAYSAAGNLPKRLHSLGDKNLLGISGSELDEIIEVGETINQMKQDRSLLQSLRIVAQLAPTYCTGQPRLDVFWRTLLADMIDGQCPAPESLWMPFRYWVMFKMGKAFIENTHSKAVWESTMAYMDELARADPIGRLPSHERILNFAEVYQQEKDTTTDDVPSLTTAATKLMNQFDEKIEGAHPFRLFITRKRYLGMGQLSLRAGDRCWIIPGSIVPLILRPSDSEGRYQLVGETYLHGFMQGEALKQEGFELEDIELE